MSFYSTTIEPPFLQYHPNCKVIPKCPPSLVDWSDPTITTGLAFAHWDKKVAELDLSAAAGRKVTPTAPFTQERFAAMAAAGQKIMPKHQLWHDK